MSIFRSRNKAFWIWFSSPIWCCILFLDFLSIIISKNKITKKKNKLKHDQRTFIQIAHFNVIQLDPRLHWKITFWKTRGFFFKKKTKKKRLFTGNPDILSLPLCATWKGFFISNRYRGKRNKAIISCCICYLYQFICAI